VVPQYSQSIHLQRLRTLADDAPDVILRGCSIVQKIVIEILIEIVIEIGRRGSTVQRIVIEN